MAPPMPRLRSPRVRAAGRSARRRAPAGRGTWRQGPERLRPAIHGPHRRSGLDPRPMLKGVLTVGGWTMASRILGFARDMLIAAKLGAGPMADAFFVALKLPNLFRRLFGEGAFNAAFIPAFSGTLATQGPQAARDLAERMLALMTLWLSSMVLLG